MRLARLQCRSETARKVMPKTGERPITPSPKYMRTPSLGSRISLPEKLYQTPFQATFQATFRELWVDFESCQRYEAQKRLFFT